MQLLTKETLNKSTFVIPAFAGITTCSGLSYGFRQLPVKASRQLPINTVCRLVAKVVALPAASAGRRTVAGAIIAAEAMTATAATIALVDATIAPVLVRQLPSFAKSCRR